MKIASSFGAILRKARIDAGLSQQDLAEDSKLNRTFISMLELGKRQPTITTLIQIARVLDIKPSEMLRQWEKDNW